MNKVKLIVQYPDETTSIELPLGPVDMKVLGPKLMGMAVTKGVGDNEIVGKVIDVTVVKK